jgi:hypothetical protein
MANEFIIRKGFISLTDSQITGSLNVTAGITGSLLGTASFATSASYALSASYSLTATSASYASSSTSASYAGTASVLLGSVVSASYAATASYVVNALTASYIVTAQTASYVLNAVSASFASTSISSSFASTASFLTTANNYQMNSLGVGVAPASPFKGNFYGQVIVQNGINNATGQQSLIFAYPGITNSLTHSIFSGHDASVANYNKLDFYVARTTGLSALNVLSLRSSQPVLIGSGSGLGLVLRLELRLGLGLGLRVGLGLGLGLGLRLE